MSQLLIVLLLFLAAGFVLAAKLPRTRSGRPSRPARIALAIGGTCLAAFCAFGFVASGEAGNNHLVWRAAYGGAGVLAALSAVRSLRPAAQR